jgi:hypothetical protein
MRKKIADSTRKKIIRLWIQGLSYKQIAIATGTSNGTAARTITQYNSNKLIKHPNILCPKNSPSIIQRIRFSLKKMTSKY